MKKMKTTILLLLISLFTFKTQAQESYKGNILISAYCGLPNTLRLNLAATEDIPNDARYSGLSPFGIRGVIKVNDKVSIGFDVIYGFAKAKYSITDSIFTNGQWASETNDYSISKQRLRPQFRINRHFTTGSNLDHYVGFAVGGNSRWTKEYVNKVLITENTKESTIGLSMRLCYGFSYSLTQNIGLGGEIGLGGPLLQMAVTYKL
jgi:hypothetical protein